MNEEDLKIIKNAIRDIPDFPKPGIIFKDITTLLNDKNAFNILMNYLKNRYKSYNLDFIAGIDARGFIFGATLAQMLGIGFVPVRKQGKLPYTTISEKYSLEYGFDEVEIHIDAFRDIQNARVLLIDDLIATGGTANAAVSLINKANAKCVEACFILGLNFLNGQELVNKSTPVYTVLGID